MAASTVLEGTHGVAGAVGSTARTDCTAASTIKSAFGNFISDDVSSSSLVFCKMSEFLRARSHNIDQNGKQNKRHTPSDCYVIQMSRYAARIMCV